MDAGPIGRNLKAEERYRQAFHRWADSFDEAERERLEDEMDGLQTQIAYCPDDPRWVAFKETLPELDEAFGAKLAVALRDLKSRFSI